MSWTTHKGMSQRFWNIFWAGAIVERLLMFVVLGFSQNRFVMSVMRR
jgi:hypothetical protein